MNAIKFATLKSYRGLSYSFIMVPTKPRNELKVQLTKLRSITHCHTYNTLLDYIKYVHLNPSSSNDAASAVDTQYTRPLFDMVGLAFIKISVCLTVSMSSLVGNEKDGDGPAGWRN